MRKSLRSSSLFVAQEAVQEAAAEAEAPVGPLLLVVLVVGEEEEAEGVAAVHLHPSWLEKMAMTAQMMKASLGTMNITESHPEKSKARRTLLKATSS